MLMGNINRRLGQFSSRENVVLNLGFEKGQFDDDGS